MNFDPFYDYDSIASEMVDDLHKAVVDNTASVKLFAREKTRENAISVLKAQRQIQIVYDNVMQTLWTVPAMIHLAGEKKIEVHPETEIEGVVQRCKRCGSVLQFWYEGLIHMTSVGPQQVDEDDVSWWRDGDRVGKCSHEHGINLYEIDPQRSLEKHERDCVNMAGVIDSMFGDENRG